jgi:hypothetical protein
MCIFVDPSIWKRTCKFVTHLMQQGRGVLKHWPPAWMFNDGICARGIYYEILFRHYEIPQTEI